MGRMMNMTFYAFQYDASTNTTSGTPNARTGRMNVAGKIAVFSDKSSRDEWVDQICKLDRKKLTNVEARKHCDGMIKSEFQDYCYSILDDELDTLMTMGVPT